MAAGEGSGQASGNAIWSVVWFLILFFIGIWLASICAFLYIIFSIFAACIEALDPVCDVLLKGIQLTGTCAKHMVKGTPVNEAMK